MNLIRVKMREPSFWGRLTSRRRLPVYFRWPWQRRGGKAFCLALQGGGSHGAFTWGVLDRLLDDETFRIEGISGASAGAMNAAVLAQGLMEGGPEGARAALARFWDEIAHIARFSPLNAPGAHVPFDVLSRLVSPYQFNPWALNPLRDLLNRLIDFPRLRRESPVKLFIAATRVSTGRTRIFRESELDAEMLLASACLPVLHHAVEIDGEYYWDGGYSANPPLLALVQGCVSDDLLLVQLIPSDHPSLPVTGPDIAARLGRVMFNGPLLHELQVLEELRSQRGLRLPGRNGARFEKLRLHQIGVDHLPEEFRRSSALAVNPHALRKLHQEGVKAAEGWLAGKG